MKSYYVAQADLKLLGSSDRPTSISQSAEMTATAPPAKIESLRAHIKHTREVADGIGRMSVSITDEGKAKWDSGFAQMDNENVLWVKEHDF